MTQNDPLTNQIKAWKFDVDDRTKTEFKLPGSLLSMGSIRQTSQGDWIFSLGFEVYRGDGRTFRLLLSKDELYQYAKSPGVFRNIRDLLLDANDRVFLHLGPSLLLLDAAKK